MNLATSSRLRRANTTGDPSNFHQSVPSVSTNRTQFPDSSRIEARTRHVDNNRAINNSSNVSDDEGDSDVEVKFIQKFPN